MALNLGVMSAAVTLDDSDYRSKLSGIENASEGSFKRIAQLAASYLSARALFGFAKEGVQAFANLETASWNFSQVFKQIPADAAAAEEEMRKTYKLSETTSKTLLTNAADQLQSFGFSAKQSLELARQVSERGIDLASFKGGNQADAVSALTRALTGETESLKRYGIVVQQGSKQFQELTDSIKRTTGCTELQAKSQAILKTIMEQSKNAAGDYTKEGSTIAQQQMDLAEATIRAKESFGAFLAEGVSPLMETWRQLLVGFAETPPEMQRLEIRTAATAGAFLLLAKSGLLAKSNMAISGIINAVTSANTALAESATIAGKAHIVMAGGINTAKTALNGLAASLGPIGAAMIALSAVYLAYNYLVDQNNKFYEQSLTESQSRVDAANAEAEANQKQRDEEANKLSRLEELSKYERLNNSEMKEAKKLTDELSGVYKNLGISIDETTGKIKIGTNAWQELNGEQAKAARNDLANQVGAQNSLVTAQMNNLRNELGSFWKNTAINQAATSIAAAIKRPFDSRSDEEWNRAVDKARFSERQVELDDIMKLKTAEEQLAGLEKMRNSLYSEGEEEQAKKVEEVIQSLKKQIGLEKQLTDARKKAQEPQPNQKITNSGTRELRAQSEAERKALNSLEAKEWEIKFNSADSSQKDEMLSQQIDDIFRKQSGKYSTLGDFMNADRAQMSEQELKDLQEIIQLEQKRADIRQRSADAFQSESESYQKFLEERAQKENESKIEQEIKDAQNSGDSAKANSIMQREYNLAMQAAQKLRLEYEQAVQAAEADGIMTEAERKRLSELRTDMQKSMSDEDKWKGRIDESDNKQQKNAQNTFGSFSAALLNAMLGGKSPEEETAKNTKEMVRLARLQANSNSSMSYS